MAGVLVRPWWAVASVLVGASLSVPASAQSDGLAVDLSEDSLGSIQQAGPSQEGAARLGRQWFENFHLSGFGAVAFLDTGNAGTRPEGGFMVKEASLFVEAEVWSDVGFFVEVQTNRLGKDDSLFVRTGEVYAHFTNVLSDRWGDGALGIKVGRIDIPFGEEYLWQDAIDNPLITQSAAYPYGFDEGLLLYGTARGVNWIFSVTDGNDERSEEDGSSKAFNVKLSTDVTDALYVSASGMVNGLAGKSAFEFGGSHFQPIGAGRPSAAGTSPSARVDAALYEVNAILQVGEAAQVSASFGQAHQSDDTPGFDRDLMWGMFEGQVDLTERAYVGARISEFGTYSDTKGYHMDGKIIAGGNSAFGYDAKRLQRIAAGVGYRPNAMTTVKLEVGRDRFWLIDASPFSANGESRFYFGAELALRF